MRRKKRERTSPFPNSMRKRAIKLENRRAR